MPFETLRSPRNLPGPQPPEWRSILFRYGVTITAVLATVLLVPLSPWGQIGVVVAFVVLCACSWFGGVGPALLAPFLLSIAIKVNEKGLPHAFDLNAKEWINTAAVALLTTAIGQSGKMQRRAQAVARRQAGQLSDQARALSLAHIIFHDFDGRITDWNEGVQRIYGFAYDEARGRPIHELLKTRFPKPLAEIRNELLARREWEGEVVHTRKDGAELIVATHWILYSSESGTDLKIAEVNNDVTEVRRAEEAIREADRRKDRFLATLAHELRNPLAPVRNGLEILRLSGDVPSDPAAVREVREMMQRQIERMVRLIDDLLDVSRINTGKIELHRERLAIDEVVRDAVEASRPHIDAAQHELTVTLPAEPLVVDGDRARLSQALLNLLNNAAKFTSPKGKITLHAARVGDGVEIRVRDTGIGIPRDMLPRVFDMFTQVDSSRHRSHGGLGIGLGLVRTLIEMHGGTVEAQSEGEGRGSEFIVRLPLPVGAAVSRDS